jgi:hypothetical protein
MKKIGKKKQETNISQKQYLKKTTKKESKQMKQGSGNGIKYF